MDREAWWAAVLGVTKSRTRLNDCTESLSLYIYVCTHTHTHTPWIEYYSDIKNEIIPFTATWLDLEMTTLSEISQEEKDNYHMDSLECIIKKKKKNQTEEQSTGGCQKVGGE